jgi:TetR/AcrR family transcriptional regulator
MKQENQNTKKDKTIRKIIDAASQIFSEVGFAGARVDDIAEKAGVNKATIYYHIGNKDILYAHMMHDIFSNATEQIAGSVKAEKGPEEKLRVYIRGFTRLIDGHPHIAPLMLREVASGGQHIPNIVARNMADIVSLLTDILDHGVRSRIFVKTLPLIIHMIIIGTAAFYKSSEPVRTRYPVLTNLDYQPDANLKGHFGDEIEKIILKAVKKPD